MTGDPIAAARGHGEVSFADFTADLKCRELYKGGRRVHLRDQSFEALACLLENAGDLVTREQLYKRIWGEETFVDFARNLNVAVTRLREALGDSARQPIYIETVPRRGYRFIYPLDNSKSSPPAVSIFGLVVLAVCAIAALATMLYVGPRVLAPEPAAFVLRTPRQLTTDPGWSAWPDISQDGRLVVFSSDRDGGPDLDLWLLHIDSGESRQLTNEPGDEVQPRFAADASRVAFYGTAERASYVVATSGGAPRVVARESWYPRFSWDGKYLAMTRNDPARGFSSKLVLADADGSNQRIVGEHMRFLGAGLTWTADHRILAGGTAEFNWRAGDWFLIDPEELALQKTSAAELVTVDRFDYSRPPPLGPLAWLEPEGAGVFSARQGDSIDLWTVPIDLATGLATGNPTHLTSGGDLNFDVGTSPNGAIVYSSTQQNIDIWRLPLDPATHQATGPPERLTRGAGAEFRPVVSRDGRSMAYLSSAAVRNPRESDVHVSPLPAFESRQLTGKNANYLDLAIGPEGRQFLLWLRDSEGMATRSVSIDSPAPIAACPDCGRLWAWSPDKRYIVHGGAERAPEFRVRDSHTGMDHVVAEHESHWIGNAQFSADGRWIVFGAIVRGMVARQIFVMRFLVDELQHENDWIALTGSDGFSFQPQWSPDGEWIYYFSDHSGPIAIWAQRVDADTKQPRGKPVLVYEAAAGQPKFHSDQLTGLGLPTLAVGDDFLLFDSANTRGNVWLLEPDTPVE